MHLKCEMPIEPHLVLKHISFLSTPKNPIFLLVTRVNTRDSTVLSAESTCAVLCIADIVKPFVDKSGWKHR